MHDLSLEVAYRDWAHDLVGFASTMISPDDAVDAVADVFARLLADPERWHAVREPQRYLFRSVANEVKMRHRSADRRHARERVHWSGATEGPSVQPGELIVDERIATAVAALSPQQCAAVYLTYWVDQPVDVVADILGVRPGTVRRQLARARLKLRGVLT